MRITKKCPAHAGEILLQEFMQPMQLSIATVATKLAYSESQVKQILQGTRLTADDANRLANAFGNSPSFWHNIQTAVDQWQQQNLL